MFIHSTIFGKIPQRDMLNLSVILILINCLIKWCHLMKYNNSLLSYHISYHYDTTPLNLLVKRSGSLKSS